MNRQGIVASLLVFVMLMSVASAAITTVPATGDITFETNTGLAVTDQDVADVPQEPFVDSQTIQLAGGTVSSSSGGDISILTSLDSATPKFDGIDAQGSILRNTSVANDVEVSGDLNRVNTTAMTLDDGAIDFEFAGTSGTTTVTVFDLPANTGIFAVEGSTILAADTSNSTGAATFAGMTNSEHDVELKTATAPVIDNATASPQGQTFVEPVFSIDVADADFGDGDLLDVTLEVEGVVTNTTSIGSNQTVSFPGSDQLTGTVNYTFTATDEAGLTTTSQTFSFELPEDIVVRPVAAPQTAIDGTATGAEATARFFRDGNDVVVVRDVDANGRLDLVGLPADTRYFIQINSTGFENRRSLIDSLFDQDEIFLLNSSTPASQVVVNIEDRTGGFGAGSTIQIERPINTTASGPGNEQYRVIAGDTIGSKAQFSTTLENGVRYRVKVTSPAGQQRQLGAFVVNQPRAINLVISGIQQGVTVPDDGGEVITNQTVADSGEKTVNFRYIDPANATSALTLRIEEAGNSSNVFATTQPSRVVFPLGEFKFSQTFSAGSEAADVQLVANVTYTRQGSDEQVVQAFGADRFPVNIPLDEGWASIFGVGLLLIVGGIFSRANARIGALVIPAVALMLNLTGILSGVVTLASVGVAFAIAVGINLVQTTGGIR